MSNNDWLPITVHDSRTEASFSYSLQCLGSCILRCHMCTRLLLITPQSTRNLFCTVCDEPLSLSLEAMMMTPGVIVKAFNVEKPFDIEQFLRIESLQGRLRPSSVVRMGYLLIEKAMKPITTPGNKSKSPSKSRSKPPTVLSSLLYQMRTPTKTRTLTHMGWTQVLAVQNGCYLRFYSTKPVKHSDSVCRHMLLEALNLVQCQIERVKVQRSGATGLMYSHNSSKPCRLRLTTDDAVFTINIGTDLLTSWWQTCLEKAVQIHQERFAKLTLNSAALHTPTSPNAFALSPTRRELPTPIIAAPAYRTSSQTSGSSDQSLSVRTICTAFQMDSLSSVSDLQSSMASSDSTDSRSSLASQPPSRASQTVQGLDRPLRKSRSYFLGRVRAECRESMATNSSLIGLACLAAGNDRSSSRETLTSTTSRESAKVVRGSIIQRERFNSMSSTSSTDSDESELEGETLRIKDSASIVHQQSIVKVQPASCTVIPSGQPRPRPTATESIRSKCQKRYSRYYEQSPISMFNSTYGHGRGLAAALDDTLAAMQPASVTVTSSQLAPKASDSESIPAQRLKRVPTVMRPALRNTVSLRDLVSARQQSATSTRPHQPSDMVRPQSLVRTDAPPATMGALDGKLRRQQSSPNLSGLRNEITPDATPELGLKHTATGDSLSSRYSVVSTASTAVNSPELVEASALANLSRLNKSAQSILRPTSTYSAISDSTTASPSLSATSTLSSDSEGEDDCSPLKKRALTTTGAKPSSEHCGFSATNPFLALIATNSTLSNATTPAMVACRDR
ncbi:hypothetical protein H4R34_000176 [Dimargaris verticillata]|uniref:PH domain-containing protein n=1 Tax=Dimargaris verticillata TaxID=2761393 RepID=A0A9W8B5V0_9FUNG|nr:hypothetical protein H4R34_000176 [Dimargaris verticillata]